jgi:hypothetical protein
MTRHPSSTTTTTTTAAPLPPYTSRECHLEIALIANFLIHGLALLAMAALLIPFMPGGPTTSDAERVRLIAEHPWRFRMGWLPWQLCAVADGYLAIAMVRVKWLPKLPSMIVLVFTMAAILPDQYSQAMWVTKGVDIARSGDVETYLAFEAVMFPLTAAVAALLYTIAGALGWTWAFAAAKTWTRTLTFLSVPLWIAMLIAVTGPLLPTSMRPSPTFVSTANAIGFLTLQLWLGLVTEAVLRRARPYEPHGRLAEWRYPGKGPIAFLANALANSRLFGTILEPLPEVAMKSDITDVIYVNYVVDAERLEPYVPEGLELQRVGAEKKHALFTFLTFRHGNFGPAFLGPLRKLLPSPVQTNWRIHVVDPKTGHRGIYFVTNAVTHPIPAFGARLFTEGMPMHILEQGTITRDAKSGDVEVHLSAGKGSAPDARIKLTPLKDAPALEDVPLFRECWDDFRDFLSYCVPQDRAMSSQPLRRRVSRQEIDLGIPIDQCEPLDVVTIESVAANAIVGDLAKQKAIGFRVPKVSFMFSVEAHDSRPHRPA